MSADRPLGDAGGARSGASKGRRLGRLVLLLLVVLLALSWFRVGPAPEIAIEPELPAVGPSTPVAVSLSEARRGLGTVQIRWSQGEKGGILLDEGFEPRPFWAFWGPRTASRRYDLILGPSTLAGLEEGSVALEVVASRAPTWLRHPQPVRQLLDLPVRLRPPALETLGGPYYATQGGSGLVVYRVGRESHRDGVQAGDRWFPGYPLPGGSEGERFCLFGIPYDLDNRDAVRLQARDELGNQIDFAFLGQLKRQPPSTDTIRLDDAFLARVVPRIQAETTQLHSTGVLLQDYLVINRELRRCNGQELEQLAEVTAPAFLWSGAFRQLPGSQVMSTFADRRTYVYQGQEVDRQDHLGFDLASTRQAPVPAANSGTVVLARYLGIYGRTVVVDHGCGLMSLYAHLSSLKVEEGQSVQQGDVLGLTGSTGLAGGDHLHFTLLLQGLPVNPVEWWDPLWIERRIEDPLKAAVGPLPGAPPAGSP